MVRAARIELATTRFQTGAPSLGDDSVGGDARSLRLARGVVVVTGLNRDRLFSTSNYVAVDRTVGFTLVGLLDFTRAERRDLAGPTGFEPAFSCVTGRRPLQAGPRSQVGRSSRR